MLKVDVEPIAPRLLNNRIVHSNYLRLTQEQAAILREVVEQGKSQNPLNNSLDHAFKYTKRIQELLILIRQTCPSINNPSHKLVAVTPKNKDKKVRFVEPVTSSGDTNKKTSSLSNLVSNKPMSSSTGVKSSTSASESQPSGNVCPLTRITATTEVPSRKPIALETDTPKPVVTLVYSRKLRKSKTTDPVRKSNVIKYVSANKRNPVYYVEGLGHNLFFVRQLCDLNLEVAFRQHTCYIRNLEGVDLLTGSRGNNLYTLSLGDMMMSSPICLLLKASKTKSWLWHQHLSHLNFGTINHLARHGLVRAPEVIALIIEVVALDSAASTSSPSSTTIDQDAPSPRSLLNMRQTHTPFESIGRWTKDYPIANVISDPFRSVLTRKQLQTDAMWCFFDAFLTLVEPKNFKQAITKPSWIDAMQKEIHEFERCSGSDTLHMESRERLTSGKIYVDDIIFASTNTAICNEFANLMTSKFKMSMMGKMSFFLGLQISQSPRGIFINQSKYASEIVKKYGMLSSDSVDTPLVEKSKLNEDLQWKPVDATLYCGMIESSMYLTSSRPDLTYAVWLCARSVQHSRAKHIDVWYLFIKEQVENRIVELYFVQTEYQLADIFIKPLPRESFNFLIEKLGIKSMSLDTLKHLAEETDEIMDTTRAQQKALDDELVAPANRLKIGKCNLRLSSNLNSNEPTLQVVLDALKLTSFYKAFEITADVLEIYMQEFWVTIYPKLPGQKFEDPLFEEEILSFIRELGHTGEIKVLSDVNVNHMHQPWRSFAAINNKCLSAKTTALKSLRLS
nr:uncharacterized mitochondrial protein AtMg00810-like [Tanacetum cinerariifolium]